VWKYVGYLILLASLAVGAATYARMYGFAAPARHEAAKKTALSVPDWLADLHSQNPHDLQDGTATVERLGGKALPAIEAVLRDPASDPEHRKAALRACGILGFKAAPAIPAVALELNDPALAEDAAVALSFMGPGAYPALRTGAASPDPVVRRESLRSVGKLHFRASLPSAEVLPLLTDAMADEDAGVRTVAATYLGILNDDPGTSVPLLVEGLADDDPAVRTAAATALGAFGGEARDALPALRRAAGDHDPELAREAGRAVVRITSAGI
jgi:HEAT repeat protein